MQQTTRQRVIRPAFHRRKIILGLHRAQQELEAVLGSANGEAAEASIGTRSNTHHPCQHQITRDPSRPRFNWDYRRFKDYEWLCKLDMSV